MDQKDNSCKFSNRDIIRRKLYLAADEMDNNAREGQVMDQLARSFDYGTNQFNVYQKTNNEIFNEKYSHLVDNLSQLDNSYKMRIGGSNQVYGVSAELFKQRYNELMKEIYPDKMELSNCDMKKLEEEICNKCRKDEREKMETKTFYKIKQAEKNLEEKFEGKLDEKLGEILNEDEDEDDIDVDNNPWIDFLRNVRQDPESFGIDPEKNLLKQASKLYREMNSMKPKTKNKGGSHFNYKQFLQHVSKNKAKFGINKKKNFIRQTSRLWEKYKAGNLDVEYTNIDEPFNKRIPVVKRKKKKTTAGKIEDDFNIDISKVSDVHKKSTKQRQKLNKRSMETEKDKDNTVKEFGDILSDMAEEESQDATMIADSAAKMNKKKKNKSELKKQLKIVTKHIN